MPNSDRSADCASSSVPDLTPKFRRMELVLEAAGFGVWSWNLPDGAIEMVAMVDSTHRQQAEDCVLDPEQPFPLFDNQVEHLSAPTVRPALSPAGGTIVVPPTKSKDQF